MDVIDDEIEGMSEKEFIESVRGKRVVELRIGDSGFDLVFEGGVVLETYDLCLMYSRIRDMCKECDVEACEPLGREVHERILKKFVKRKVVDVEYNVGNCVFVFHLDNGESVCIPVEYGYVIDREVDDDGGEV